MVFHHVLEEWLVCFKLIFVACLGCTIIDKKDKKI